MSETEDKKISAFKDIIKKLNKKQGKLRISWFVCDSCNALNSDEIPRYMATSKWGSERPFCSSCTNYCKECSEYYSNSMSYQHDDCNNSEENDPTESSDHS